MNKRKRKVLSAAHELFVEKGYVATSILDILERAEISKGTFYNYFTSKNHCLMSIIESGREQADLKRKEVIIGKSLTDHEVLAEQIMILMRVHNEQNLVPIYEMIAHSGEPELKRSMLESSMGEISWLADRLGHIYGESDKKYLFDLSVFFYGSFFQSLKIWGIVLGDQPDIKRMILYLLKFMGTALQQNKKDENVLLGDGIELYFQNLEPIKHINANKLADQLEGFLVGLDTTKNDKSIQLTQFLVEQFQSEHPQLYVIETVLPTFRHAFTGTEHEREASEIALLIWKYIEQQQL